MHKGPAQLTSLVMLHSHMNPKSDRGSWDEKVKKAHYLNAKAINELFVPCVRLNTLDYLGALQLERFGNFYK